MHRQQYWAQYQSFLLACMRDYIRLPHSQVISCRLYHWSQQLPITPFPKTNKLVQPCMYNIRRRRLSICRLISAWVRPDVVSWISQSSKKWLQIPIGGKSLIFRFLELPIFYLFIFFLRLPAICSSNIENLGIRNCNACSFNNCNSWEIPQRCWCRCLQKHPETQLQAGNA